jgi:hypothetical protein
LDLSVLEVRSKQIVDVRRYLEEVFSLRREKSLGQDMRSKAPEKSTNKPST